jgi:Domain of unknown function (DUF222)
MTSASDHEPSGPGGVPGPGPSVPPGPRGVPEGDFCNELGGWDLDREPPSEEELHGVVFDPGNSPIEGWEVMSDAQRRELLGGDLYPGEDGEDTAPEALEAGFTHRHGGTGAGFAAGGPLDVMLPGPGLAWHAGAARQRGLGTLSDDELIGLLGGARRLESWSAGLELAVVAELDARRAGPHGREGEHVAEELAAALTLTGRAAASLLELSRELERLPQTTALLAAGVIDRTRAAMIVGQLSLLSDAGAAAVEDRVARRAGAMTTGRLAAACQRAVLAYDPQAAARRKDKAEQQARVECWAEPAGTGAIAGRDLNLAAVITADKHLDAAARWLQRHGAAGTIDQLRAQAFLARLAGQPLDTLLPRPARPGAPTAPGGPAGANPATPASPGTPANPASADPGGSGGPNPGASARPGSWPGGLGGPSGLTGTVNLVMPATTWLGLTDAPGEIAGTGAADADTCRDLAAAIAACAASRWCLTLTSPNGQAIAHGCARAGPGPPGTTGPAAWLARITLTPIETGTCAHRRETTAYRPPDSLRHLIKIRSPRCGYPGCRRPAARCDNDHTIPHHKGGKTCECNLHPLCRRHHQTKQARGWHLSQPEPGTLTWTTPSGRTYATEPEPYPA